MAYQWQIKRRNQTKKKILDAAIKTIAKNGFHDAQIVEISTMAGVSAGTFYKYFEDKKDLFMFLIENVGNVVINTIREQCDVKNAKSIDDVLSYINFTLKLYFDAINKNENIFLAITKSFFGPDDDIDELAWTFVDSIAVELSGTIDYAVDLGFIKKDIDSKDIAKILIGIVIQVSMIIIRDKSLSHKQGLELTYKAFVGVFIPYINDDFAERLTLKDGLNLINSMFNS